ncbi:PucR family transcriptional regulator ligand-binding domain-containing protein [uncultured Anaeromusa sp.]|uniref:PucR family transcriptional regulator n=1 Tax=uncultured Anaeromusa sp. TaxID=673273 RepID=UPI0029C6C5F6|nr:PucR family transcriptional regulator ligand-binding domain-containing protein [uncultured Anaeromusa sp.]
MAIRLGRLYKQTRKLYQMELVAGARNLDNLVNWVHMIEDVEVADFLHGSELVFTTGIAQRREGWLNEFVQELVKHNASGLVVNVGPYIKMVPPETSAYCQELGLPLFTVPWNVRLVDVTQDICRRIFQSEQTEMTVSAAFKNAIFFPADSEKYMAQLESHGFSGKNDYCVIVLAGERLGGDESLSLWRFAAENTISRLAEKYSVFKHGGQLVLVLAGLSEAEQELCAERLGALGEKPGYGNIYAGVGRNQSGIMNLARSYQQALAAVQMAKQRHWTKAFYRELGIYKLLLSGEQKMVLQELYEETLGRLAAYDAVHSTDYLEVLRCYLEQDGSVQAVAKLTYVHRNTINYKLKKIRELTGCDLAGSEDRLQLMLALKIKEVLF